MEQQGEKRSYDKLPGQYMPDRIISYCSGANNSMEDILIASPRASLASDLYDFALSGAPNTVYFYMRNGLMERLNMSFIPVAFSFGVNDERLERFWDLPQIGLLGRLFRKDSDESRELRIVPGVLSMMVMVSARTWILWHPLTIMNYLWESIRLI